MTLKERYAGVIGWFEANMPVAESELQYKDPYQLLVAVILWRSVPTSGST